MHRLTRKDRDFLLGELERLVGEPSGDTDDLVKNASDWVSGLPRAHGLERVLVRDVTALCAHVRSQRNTDARRLASAALAFILKNPIGNDEAAVINRLPGLAFLASITLHEIRNREHGRAAYDPPAISSEERKNAESLFLQHTDTPLFDDPELVRRGRKFCEDITPLAGSPFLGRIIHGVRTLVSTLEGAGVDEERVWARAGLSYVLRPDDSIDDRLGLVGLLDDLFVVEMATNMIRPDREPWNVLFNGIMSAWPFLLDTLLGDSADDASPPSELVLVHAALAHGDFAGPRESQDRPHITAIVTPTAGPLPFLVSFLTAVSAVKREARQTSERFKPGDLIMVDGAACAIYRGRKMDSAGGMRILLEQKPRSSRVTYQAVYLPIEDEYRLALAPPGRVATGVISRGLPLGQRRITALERLFNSYEPGSIAQPDHSVLVVTDASEAKTLAARIKLHGQPLCHVLPMGHLSRFGHVRGWSDDVFGATKPVLMCCSDIDRAADYLDRAADDHGDHSTRDISFIVLDIAGSNTDRHAGLRRILGTGMPVLMFVNEDDDQVLPILDEYRCRTWNWTAADFSQLVWPAGEQPGPLAGFERRMRNLAGGSTTVELVDIPDARRAYDSLCSIEYRSDSRDDPRSVGPEHHDLTEIRAEGFGVLCSLLRRIEPLAPGEEERLLKERIARIDRRIRDSRYLAEGERHVALSAIDALLGLLGSLEKVNPKGEAIASLLRRHPDLVVLDGEQSDIEGSTRGRGAIITGWWGRDRMSRLLRPPVSDPLVLLLYEPEDAWYRSFLRRLAQRQSARERRYPREAVFSGLGPLWKAKPHHVEAAEAPQPRAELDLEQIGREIFEARRRRYLDTAPQGTGDQDVETRMLTFEHGAAAFITETYDVNVVTHLVQIGAGSKENGVVKVRHVDQLRPDDYLLFPVGSDRDAIRQAADRLLGAKTRELAKMWQRALRAWRTQKGLKVQEICDLFRRHGCSRHQATVRRWIEDDMLIAPRFERDLRTMADLAGEPEFKERIEECVEAVSKVWSAHLRAAGELARKVVDQAVHQLAGANTGPTRLEDVYLVRVEHVDVERTPVPRGMANRLLQDPEHLTANEVADEATTDRA